MDFSEISVSLDRRSLIPPPSSLRLFMEPKKPRLVLDILCDLVDTTEELQKNVQKLVKLDQELRNEEDRHNLP